MTPLLSIRGLTKSFGGVPALKPFDLDLHAGDILGLVGENGAGKSTLIKLISGVHKPDSGRIDWCGQPVRFSSPRDALAAGIATIYQELEYLARLSVAENMLLGEPWPRTWWGAVDWKELHAEARRRLAAFDVGVSTYAALETLTAAEKQDVSIATALARDARLLILDEPTASLSEPEVERLFAALRRLTRQGVTIVYVSHRLDEVLSMTNRVAVLRDGRLAASYPTAEVNVHQIITDMLGRPLDPARSAPIHRGPARSAPIHRGGGTTNSPSTEPPPLLELQGLSRSGLFQNITFQVHAGEIVGLAGLVGAGRSELARAIYGMYPCDTGEMRLLGSRWTPRGPEASIQRGLVYLPEERKRQGLVLDHSLQESISIGFSDLLSKLGLIDRRQERARVASALKQYDIRAESASQTIGTLSGGNQQKALLARWLERDPAVIILDEPTRGVDVGAKAQIHALIARLAAAGKGIVLISSDLPELLELSDRILVMNRGSIGAELRGAEMTEHNVILAASGLPLDQPVAL